MGPLRGREWLRRLESRGGGPEGWAAVFGVAHIEQAARRAALRSVQLEQVHSPAAAISTGRREVGSELPWCWTMS